MTTGQETPASLRCPRCGGAMYKPAGSLFYWHTDYNHPRCEITNISDVPKAVTPPDDHPDPSPPGRPARKK